MNITFLIGNGFDLNIGLATTYSAFLEEYAKPSDKDNDLLKYFKQKILKDAKMWSNAEMAFGDIPPRIFASVMKTSALSWPNIFLGRKSA